MALQGFTSKSSSGKNCAESCKLQAELRFEAFRREGNSGRAIPENLKGIILPPRKQLDKHYPLSTFKGL